MPSIARAPPDIQKSNFMSIQKSIDDLRQSQDRCEQMLQRLIQQASMQPATKGTASYAKVKGSDAMDSKAKEKKSQVVDIWEDFQISVTEFDVHHNSYTRITDRLANEAVSLWHLLFRRMGLLHLLHTEHPRNRLARITQHSVFNALQACLILGNTVIMGYEVDSGIKAVVQVPRGSMPGWLDTCNLWFNVIFAGELLFRIIALRSWFWVSPEDWGWNVFDVVVVMSSLLTDILGSINLSFLRTFRILRAVRAVRVIRMLRFFRELRKIMFAIMSCLKSLMWCFVFLVMTMFMFSILILQGMADALSEMEPGSQDHNSASDLVKKWYPSLGDTMFSLLAAFTAGTDFFTFLDPIEPAGVIYSAAYILYILFVVVGVMNVLTGVFLAAADSFQDRSLMIQDEQLEQESFVQTMLQVFEDLDIDANGVITWEEFKRALKDEHLQAFLSAHRFEVTHAKLVFDVLDERGTGQINLLQFVMGMLRMKGEAKAIDARIIQREIGIIPQLLNQEMLDSQFTERQAHHI